MSLRISLLLASIVSMTAVPSAFAQRFPFERTLTVSGPITLEVSTARGKVDVSAGEPGRVEVEGDVTVRADWNVPANARELAQQVAGAPPIRQDGAVVRLELPAARDAQRAVTISYRVRVPPDTTVHTVSASGETSVRDVKGPVDVRTQSAGIAVAGLAGRVRIITGSGDVEARDMAGPVSVNTGSSTFTGTGLGSSLQVRTGSGRIEATLTGGGDVDVETGSSSVTLRGVRGALAVKSHSGAVAVSGAPQRDWTITSSSSRVDLQLAGSAGIALDAASRSGSVSVDGAPLAGEATKRSARGTLNGGGPAVRVRSSSGAIRVQTGER
jgi:hypothetical protein